MVSPLVDIRARLVEQSDVTMFRVHSRSAAYWRLMSLDRFDGSVWSSNQSYSNTGGDLQAGDEVPSPAPPSRRIEATYDLTGLSGPWAPIAFRPITLTGTDGLLWDARGSTLIARGSVGTVQGLHYRATSAVPTPSKARAAAARGAIPASVRSTDLELPADFPARFVTLAHRITSAATSPYAKAIALQNWFRDNFDYSTTVTGGESDDAIQTFLDQRKGFCEQFAGTYAVFARAIGLPTRVAVGFTSGTRSGNTFTVHGRDAHAWPEVYLSGLGWLAFEPTPGRGNPNSGTYAGGGSGTGGGQTPGTTTGPSSAGGGSSPAIPSLPSVVPPSAPSQPNAAATGRAGSAHPAAPSSNGTALLVVGLILAVLLGAGPLFRLLRRERRNRAADTAARKTLVAWSDALEAWRPLRFERRVTDTDRDTGNRLAERLSNLRGSEQLGLVATRLAELATTAAWNDRGVTDADVAEATAASRRLSRAARDHRTRRVRVLSWFDPGFGSLRYSLKRSRSRSC